MDRKKKNILLKKLETAPDEVKTKISKKEEEVEVVRGKFSGREVSDEILHFEIIEDENSLKNEILNFIKEHINEAQISKRDLYAYYDRSTAYNMLYTLQKGVISIDRLEKWLNVIGLKLKLIAVPLDDED